jgi:hypothetical protein
MIFLIDKIGKALDILVYESISDLTSRVEWQDIFEGTSTIIDESGFIFKLEPSKKGEVGLVYNYNMIQTDRKSKLIEICLEEYNLKGKPSEFKIKLH